MLNPAKRVESIELSQIRKMFEVANPDAISLGLGEPDFDLPENIKMAIKQAVDDNFSHYTSNKGDIELREAIVDKLDKDNSIKATPDDVIVTCGASESLYTCAQALFNKGDDVLIPNPGFLSYGLASPCCNVREDHRIDSIAKLIWILYDLYSSKSCHVDPFFSL